MAEVVATPSAAAAPAGNAAAPETPPAAANAAAGNAAPAVPVTPAVPVAAAPPAASPPPVPAALPATYALTLPADSPLDKTGALDRVQALAKALALPTDQAAQQVLDAANVEVAEVLRTLDVANKPGGTVYAARVAQWGEEALRAYDLGNGNADTLKGVVAEAQLELAKAPPAIRDFLEQSGYGSHPDALRWLLDVHRRTKELPLAQGDKGAQPAAKTNNLPDRLYGKKESPEAAGAVS